MKAELETPIIDRDIILTLSPEEARLLKQLCGNISKSHIQSVFYNKPSLNIVKTFNLIANIHNILKELGL